METREQAAVEVVAEIAAELREISAEFGWTGLVASLALVAEEARQIGDRLLPQAALPQ